MNGAPDEVLLVGSLRVVVIYWAFCLDLVQGRMNGTPDDIRTHSWRFASLACQPLHHPQRPVTCYWFDLCESVVKIPFALM